MKKTITDVLAIQCRESENDTFKKAWDKCIIAFNDKTFQGVKNVQNLSFEHTRIKQMFSDDDILFVKFNSPVEIDLEGEFE